MRRNAALALLPLLAWLTLGIALSALDRRGLDASVGGTAGLGIAPIESVRVPGLILRTAAPLADALHRAWPAAADGGLPRSMDFPAWLVTYSGALRLEQGPCVLRLRHRGEVRAWVSGAELMRPERRAWKRDGWEDGFVLPASGAGWQPLRVEHRQAASGPHDAYELRGALSCQGGAFLPLDESRVRRDRGGLPLGLLQWLLLGGLLLLVPAAWRARGGPSTQAAILASVLLLGGALRVVGAGLEPAWGETMDEQAHAWSAWHLARGEAPLAWVDRDFRSAYPEVERIRFGGDTWFVAQPYLDRPPLLALLAAPLTGDSTHFWGTPLLRLRTLPLFFSCLSLLGVWAVARRLWAQHADREALALVATGLLALCLPAAMGGRLLKAEGLIVCLGGLAVLAGLGRRHPALLVGLGLLLPWAKETGALMGASVAALLALEGRRRAAAAVLSGCALGLLLLLGYAHLLAPEAAPGVLALQANKPTALHNLSQLLTRGPLAHRGFPPGDGWMLALVMLAIGTTFQAGREGPETRGLVASFLVLAVGLAALVNGAVYGWYRILLQPGLALLAAPACLALWRRPRALPLAVLYGLLVLLPLQDVLAADTSAQPWLHRLLLLPIGLLLLAEIAPEPARVRVLRGLCVVGVGALVWVCCVTAMFPLRGA